MSCSQDVLPDYELLELLLFSAVPRRDTKPMAKRGSAPSPTSSMRPRSD